MTERHPFEPFRIKSVENLRITTREEREKALNEARFNIFKIPAEFVMVDLLTDSGTGAMSSEQWASLMRGDESYAGSRSFGRLAIVVDEVFGFRHFIPTHQGRASEAILMSMLVEPGDIIPNNTHFDTTSAHVLSREGIPENLLLESSKDPNSDHPFKGNIDIDALRQLLERAADTVPFCMITVTNNAGGGQPVSLANLEKLRKLCNEFSKPLFIDACRFAENAYLIQQREENCSQLSVREIARKMFSLADGATFSAKKDAIVNIGGLLMMNDKQLFEDAKNELIMHEGFPTYGGLAGRDLDAMATGLMEGTEETYLSYRTSQVAWLYFSLKELGIPVFGPPGGHAVYVDAGQFLNHIPQPDLPAQSLAVELYLEGGVRALELGTVTLGFRIPNSDEWIHPPSELLRMAIPRRMYTQSHLQHVVDTFKVVSERKENLRGMRIVKQPLFLRHFTCEYDWVENGECLESPKQVTKEV
ncbi:MAG TPA: tryptophanase [Candidatus Thalassarchaeaceae archaeon]|nr:tryptophanase [Candidatus Thalassarchaeaceae archaeon]